MLVSPNPELEFVKPEIVFKWTEYIFFGAVLVASTGIGIFYGFFGNKNKTNDEFLMAGRSMSIFPVSLSLMCSFVSAITMLGNPVEIYNYGVQYSFLSLSVIPMTLLLFYIYVPVYFRLQLTSAYEYFEWRFSRRVRMVMCFFAVFQLLIYMPIAVYAPSLALDQVAGIDTIVSCAAIFLVCIAYSSVGGLKAVLWTDALQASVMIISLGAVVIGGMIEIGGFSVLWSRVEETNRLNFFNFDVDPRERHTVWSSLFGGCFLWSTMFIATQAQIQRYNSVPTLTASRKALILNMIGMIAITSLCAWIGMILFAKYFDCDPIQAKIAHSADQLLPLFVMEVLGKYPGIPGLLVAGLTCGSLSSVSSSLNSLAAIITVDFVKLLRPNLSETQLAVISKLVSLFSGLAAFALIYIVAEANKTVPIQAFATIVQGSFLGPILGAFSLGMLFPWTEEIGVLVGTVVSVLCSGFVGFGGTFAGRAGILPDQRLTLRTDGCAVVNSTMQVQSWSTTILPNIQYISPGDWKEFHENDHWTIQIWSLSYVWQPAIAVFSTFFVGMVVSGIVNLFKKNIPKVNESLLSYHFLKIWQVCYGKKYLNKWVDYKSPPYCGVPSEKKATV